MLFPWTSKNRQYRTETPVLVEVVGWLVYHLLSICLTALLSQIENEGGRGRRPLSLCISHRMPIPNRLRFSRLASFLSLVLYVLPPLSCQH